MDTENVCSFCAISRLSTIFPVIRYSSEVIRSANRHRYADASLTHSEVPVGHETAKDELDIIRSV